MLDKLYSGMSYSAVGVSSMLVSQQCTLNKMSLNRSTQNEVIYPSTDEHAMARGSQQLNPVLLPGTVVQY